MYASVTAISIFEEPQVQSSTFPLFIVKRQKTSLTFIIMTGLKRLFGSSQNGTDILMLWARMVHQSNEFAAEIYYFVCFIQE